MSGEIGVGSGAVAGPEGGYPSPRRVGASQSVGGEEYHFARHADDCFPGDLSSYFGGDDTSGKSGQRAWLSR